MHVYHVYDDDEPDYVDTFILQKHKTKKEVMEEIILKSKFFKVEIVPLYLNICFNSDMPVFLNFLYILLICFHFFPRHKKQKIRKRMNSCWRN